MSTTRPSALSSPALYLSNWSDIVAIWISNRQAQTDNTQSGPRLAELHLLDGPSAARGVNQIVDYTGFFRDETRRVSYTSAHGFAPKAWFEVDPANAGTLTTEYATFNGNALDLDIRKSYVAVPNQPFIVARYSITNNSPGPIVFNVLDQLHLANVAGGDPARQVHAWHDPQRNALIADMSASGQFFIVLGAFEPPDGYQVGDDTDHAPDSPTAAAWFRFNADGQLPNHGDLRAGDVDLAFQKRLTIAPGTTATVSFYLTIRLHLDAALAASDAARARPADAWFGDTAAAYSTWLTNSGRGPTVAFDDDGINSAYRANLILLKNAQNPQVGTLPAATSPYAYGHKNWARDASVAAMALDASGHTDEAELYWRWMAGVQGNDGSWKTTYSSWDGSYISFVEPEDDSVGTFLYGVCKHYLLTGDSVFLRDLWPAMQRGADFILTNLAWNGFGPADYSIWEEGNSPEHNTYTQSWYVLGLRATQTLAELRGDTDLADWYAGGPASIMTAFQRPDDAWPPGSWNTGGNYFNRAVRPDGSVNTLIDSSSNIIAALGVIDPASNRARQHVQRTTSSLACSTFGMARYANDRYYFDDPFDPAGNEALAPSPAWPQMSMWVAVHERLLGSPNALPRLQWFVSTMGAGYTAQGEAVSNVTRQSVLSSMCEPLTAASFLLAVLSFQGSFSFALRPPTQNAGAGKSVTVSFGTNGDWGQWSNLPYFIPAPPTDARATAQTTIARLSLANDGGALVVRIDNAAGTLPAFAAAPVFVVRVYSGDFSGSAPSSKVAADGGALPRAASFMVERRSDGDAYVHWRQTGSAWTRAETIVDAIAPQWDPASGRIEVMIPLWAVASAPPAIGNAWAHVFVALGIVGASGAVLEVHRALVHYRLSGPNQPWIYGDIAL